MSLLNSPLMLGFDHFERVMDRISKTAADGYPPYNIEQVGESGLRIVLAVAGFARDQLHLAVEDNQLVVHGKQEEEEERAYLHRGIAARQFRRSFLLAEGIEVKGASLDNGLLTIDLVRPKPESRSRVIDIEGGESKKAGGPSREPNTLNVAYEKEAS